MFARQPGFRVLIAAVTVLGRPPAAAAQPPTALSLGGATRIVVVDAWEGYSPVSPTRATYTLSRSADGFAGTVEISVGAGPVRRDTSYAVRLPRTTVDSLLQALSEVPLQEGSYRPTFLHTDDSPSITAELTVDGSVIRFHTRSQGAAHVPWQVSVGERSYVSGSGAIWPALGAVLGLGDRAERELVEAVRSDPESQCGHARNPASLGATSAPRPRYAGGEAWFARDSSVAVQGRTYRKYGVPRLVGPREITPYATYRGVTVFQATGLDGTPEVLYVPVHASCEVQPYVIQPQP